MSKPSEEWEKWECPPKEQAIEILTRIEEQLKTKFEELRSEKYNQNTKGYDYEEIVKQFFEDYVGGGFEVLIRMGILDAELKVLNALKPTENEFDVVGLYRNAVPKLVHRRLVPYDSVAFIIEVKQTLTIPNLENDLAKFEKIKSLKINPQRFNFNCWFPADLIKRPIRVLFYYESQADIEKVFGLLDSSDSWDLCIIVKDNNVLMNSTIPYVKKQFKQAKFIQFPEFALTKTLQFTTIFIERDYVSSWIIFWNLIRSTMKKDGS